MSKSQIQYDLAMKKKDTVYLVMQNNALKKKLNLMEIKVKELETLLFQNNIESKTQS